MDKMVEGIITAAEMVGNVRIDSVTFGLSEDIGDRSGFVTVLAHGQYDRLAVMNALMHMRGPDRVAAQEEIVGIPAIRPEHESLLLFPDDQRLVLIGGPSRDLMGAAPQEVATGVKTGLGKIAQDAGMTKLLKEVDMAKPLWLAARINDNYRQVPLLAAFDTLALTAEPRGTDLEFKVTGAGSDPAKVKAAVDEANGHISTAIKSLEEAMNRVPANVPPAMAKGAESALATLKGIKIDANDTKATGSATIKDAGQMFMMLPMFYLHDLRMGP